MKAVAFSELPAITGGTTLQQSEDHSVIHLCTDSRKTVPTETALFFAISGERHDGHEFVKALFDRGVRQFVLERRPKDLLPGANILLVKNSVEALQRLAAFHRKRFNIPVVAITGSNGKTIVKEWLFQILQGAHRVIKSPGSYNSQIGVPLSVWQLHPSAEVAVFEAGISRPGEMERLHAVLKPTIGIFTNLASAHDEGFADREEKASEKLKLFSDCEVVVYCHDQEHVDRIMSASIGNRWTWGRLPGADVRIVYETEGSLRIQCRKEEFTVNPPFKDPASVENMMHVVTALLYLGMEPVAVANGVRHLRSVSMRLQIRQGINHCVLVDDSYNNDLAGLKLSLEFLGGLAMKKKTLILSEILQTGWDVEKVAQSVAEWSTSQDLTRIELVGQSWNAHRSVFRMPVETFDSTEVFLQRFDPDRYQSEAILVKGARPFRFERIVNKLESKIHGTVMEIDQGAVVGNLNFFRSLIYPGTKIMVMVKAFAYGSGSLEVASLLQYHRVDYLGVAYTDEGVQLRKQGIHLPIMVMNPAEENFMQLMELNLEPEVYSGRQLEALKLLLDGRPCRIHVKVETGMHRLGFDEEEIPDLLNLLREAQNIEVGSVFSHLAGADEAEHDNFSAEQAVKFTKASEKISSGLGYQPLRHLLNSSGILRLPEYQFDMVRLGIGLFGIDPTSSGNTDLKPVTTLKTVVSQVKKVRSGESIGYGRKGHAMSDIEVATIAIGYADGYSRAFSRGKGVVMIRGRKAPVIGNVCMDMTMVDVTGMGVKEGDEVVIYGPGLPIQEVAERIGTIPYEILTSTSERVKRVFFAESL